MVANTFTKYAKYTVEELESYVADPNSCVQKLEWTNLVSVLPKYLGDICEGVKACLTQKIGKYDRTVDGIILAFKNTKILSPLSAIRPNSVRIHVKVSSNFYVFRPISGATIEGTIKYVSKNYLSAVIYGVFNVTIRLQKQKLQEQKQGRVISFIVKSFDMKSDLPYIEGELISTPDDLDDQLELVEHRVKKEKSPRKSIKAEPMDVQEEVTNVQTKSEADSTGMATEDGESDDEDDVERSMKAILDNLQKEMSDSASESLSKSKSGPKAQDTNKKNKRKKSGDSTKMKEKSKPKQAKLNGHDEDPKDDIEDSIKAILSGIEKEMSDVADSDYSSSQPNKSEIPTPSAIKTERIDKKPNRKNTIESGSPKKGSKRKQPKLNGHSVGEENNQHDDMEDSIQALLSGLEKEMSDAVESDHGASKLEDTKLEAPSSAKKSSGKKKKKKQEFNIDSLEQELLQKLAAEYSEPETAESAVTQSAKNKKNKSKKVKEDDFEASIMSSILKCAAYAEESESKNSPASSPSKKMGKTARKSVRFDNTITEASFNAFDSSELLEISQLQSPSLSSTLKGNS